MKHIIRIVSLVLLAASLSGCMALLLAPVANAFTDKPAQQEYTTIAKPPAVFNAALKAISAKGTATTIDRETGTIRGDIEVTMGQTAYNIVVTVQKRGEKTSLQLTAKLEGVMKFDFKNANDLVTEVAQEIERQLGTKLDKA